MPHERIYVKEQRECFLTGEATMRLAMSERRVLVKAFAGQYQRWNKREGSAVLGRFFRIVWGCIAVIVASGFAMLLEVGFAQAPRSWHVMAAVGLVMACLLYTSRCV